MSGVATAGAAIVATLGLALLVGILHNRRAGRLQPTGPATVTRTDAVAPALSTTLGLSTTGPTVVHFTAAWCGPCAAVRRVVEQVCAELPQVTHREVDLDHNVDAARALSVLSLPTTVIFDADGRQRFRSTGVPSVADLRGALAPLLA